jgi:hypothetical protein
MVRLEIVRIGLIGWVIAAVTRSSLQLRFGVVAGYAFAAVCDCLRRIRDGCDGIRSSTPNCAHASYVERVTGFRDSRDRSYVLQIANAAVALSDRWERHSSIVVALGSVAEIVCRRPCIAYNRGLSAPAKYEVGNVKMQRRRMTLSSDVFMTPFSGAAIAVTKSYPRQPSSCPLFTVPHSRPFAVAACARLVKSQNRRPIESLRVRGCGTFQVLPIGRTKVKAT